MTEQLAGRQQIREALQQNGAAGAVRRLRQEARWAASMRGKGKGAALHGKLPSQILRAQKDRRPRSAAALQSLAQMQHAAYILRHIVVMIRNLDRLRFTYGFENRPAELCAGAGTRRRPSWYWS
eukprot:COSAG01_NODE_7146_length_3331_cov_7.400062_6_plen_124_part_00